MAGVLPNLPHHAVRQREIAGDLCKRIIAGQYPPGSKLPSQTELAKLYDSCCVTAQRAVRHLQHTGHVVIKHRSGAFVSDYPPHLCNVGIAFGHTREKSGKNHFHNILRAEFEKIAGKHAAGDSLKWQISYFYGGSGFADSNDRQALMRAVEANQLAGLVLVSELKLLEKELAPMTRPPVRISFGAAGAGMVNVALHKNEPFYRKALDYLAVQGRKQVAFIINSDSYETFDKTYRQVAEMTAERSLKTYPYWLHGGPIHARRLAASAAELLMHCAPDERPDALIIRDDNFASDVTEALARTGVDIPRDLLVVAHCNYPEPTPSAVPAVRLGYDIRKVAGICLDLVRRSNGQHEVPEDVLFEPVFENELE